MAPTFGENPFQALYPGHRGVTFCGCTVICFTVFWRLSPLPRFTGVTRARCLLIGRSGAPANNAVTNSPGANLDCFSWPAKQASIRDDTSKSGQVNPGLRYQGGKPCHEIQWLEDDVGSAIFRRYLQLVADVAVCH